MKIKNVKKEAAFRDLHPALQGFFFTIGGIGLVVAGSLLGSVQILPTILVIGGFVLIAFGFYKMLSHL